MRFSGGQYFHWKLRRLWRGENAANGQIKIDRIDGASSIDLRLEQNIAALLHDVGFSP